MQRFERMRRFFHVWSRALFISVGHDVYCDGGFKITLYTLYIYFVISFFIFSTIYTLIYYDWFTRFNAIPYVSICLELLIKIQSIERADLIVGLVNKLVDVFRVNTKVLAHDRQEMLDRYSFITEYLFKVGLSTYVIAAFGFLIYPVHQYVVYNEFAPVLLLYLPYVDENTSTGYLILLVSHLNILILALLGTACSDLSFTMVIVNIPVLSNIFGDSIDDLNEALKEKRPNHRFIGARLFNIVLQHREIVEFIDILETSFFKICFVQIGCGILGMSSLLFLILKDNYIPAYGFALAFSFQIISYCAIGTVVEISNDRTYDAIMRADWYLMRCSDQLKYQFLVLNAQNAKALTVGGRADLNMITCVQVFKSIYSYAMILYSFIG